MNLQISDSANSLTLIDEHGNTVCTFAVCDEEARQVARKMVAAFNHHDELVDALDKAVKALIAERDCFYESVTDQDGNVTDPEEAETLAAFDADITALQATLTNVKP